MSETRIMREIMVLANNAGCLLMRNNSGALPDRNGRLVRFGLGHDGPNSYRSSDLIGPMPIIIGPEHLGKRLGVMVCAEIKLPGQAQWHPTTETERRQVKFIEAMRAAGCLAGVVRTPQELENLLRF